MKSILGSSLLRRSAGYLAGVVLFLTGLSTWLSSAVAETQGETIAQKMLELQNSEERWIQIDLSNQRLVAWEGGKPIYAVRVSTGKRSTPTRIGTFTIQSKRRRDRMRGADYDVPNVPYAMYYAGGYAIHGTYWHRRFGTPVSHGCVNVAVDHSKWLFNWASVGTPVIIHK